MGSSVPFIKWEIDEDSEFQFLGLFQSFQGFIGDPNYVS